MVLNEPSIDEEAEVLATVRTSGGEVGDGEVAGCEGDNGGRVAGLDMFA